MQSKHILDDEVLAKRYGVRPRARSAFLQPKFLISVLAIAFLGLVTFIGINVANPAVTGTEVRWEAKSDTELVVNIDIKMEPGEVAQCAVQALDYSKTQVGYAIVRVGPSKQANFAETITVKTQRRAVVGQVASCKLLPR